MEPATNVVGMITAEGAVAYVYLTTRNIQRSTPIGCAVVDETCVLNVEYVGVAPCERDRTTVIDSCVAIEDSIHNLNRFNGRCTGHK